MSIVKNKNFSYIRGPKGDKGDRGEPGSGIANTTGRITYNPSTKTVGFNETGLATTAYVNSSINSLINGAPVLLDTLNELAEAIGNNPNFILDVNNSIATKLSLSGGVMTGPLILDANPINHLGAVTKQYVDDATSSITINSTTDVPEGDNLYYTTDRVNADFDTRLATKSTTNLAEGTNLYYTDARFDTRLATKTTTNLTEGSNLYFTTARARASISVSGSLSYNSNTGVISYTAPADTGTTTSAGKLYGRTDSVEYIAPVQQYPATNYLFWEYATDINRPQEGYPNAIFLYNSHSDSSDFSGACANSAYPIGSDVYVRWEYHPSRENSQEIYLGKILAYKLNQYTFNQNGMIVSNPDGFDGVIGFTEYFPSRHRLVYGYVRVVINFQDGSNVAVGYEAMNHLNTGGKNVVLGYRAGQTITDGANLIVLGSGAEPSSETAQNEITLGNSSITKTRLRGALEVNESTGSVGQILKSTGSSTSPEWADIGSVLNDAIIDGGSF